jgi:hypothetical protein
LQLEATLAAAIMSERTMNASIIFTPDNEPYLGRKPLYVFDKLIVSAMELNGRVASYTHAKELNELQRAAAQIIPQGLNLALSIREMVRQGHLFTAAVLLRSLIERAAIISYLWRNPDAIKTWELGWRYKERPSLARMLETMHPDGDLEAAKRVCETFNHLAHGDPMGAEFNLVQVSEDAFGYGVGRVTDNPNLADFVCDQAISWLTILSSMLAACFPQVVQNSSS